MHKTESLRLDCSEVGESARLQNQTADFNTKNGTKNDEKRIRKTIRNFSGKFKAPLLPLKSISLALLENHFTAQILHHNNYYSFSLRRSAGVATLMISELQTHRLSRVK